MQAVAAIVLLSLMAAFAVSGTSSFDLLNTRSQDMAIRHTLAEGKQPADSSVVLILIDEASRRTIAEPLAYWQPHVATVMTAAAEAKAKVIGIDLIFTAADERAMTESRRLAQAFAEATANGTPVILGYDPGSPVPQSPLYMLATTSSPRPLGFLDLPADADDFVRRAEFCKPDAEDPAFSLGAMMASSALGQAFECGKKITTSQGVIELDDRRSFVIPFDRVATPARVSFAEVLALAQKKDTQRLQQLFAGRLVLIGSDDAQDRHATALYGSDAERTPGVVIHAAVAESLYRGSTLKIAPGWACWLMALGFALAVAGAAIVFRWQISLLAGLALVTFSFSPGGFAWHGGWVISTAPASIASFTAAALAFVYRYRTEFMAHRKLRHQFGQYVSPELVQQIIEHGVELGGTRRRITVMFSDIRGFTTLSERMSPEVLVMQLNEYLDAMSEVIIAEGGYVDKFIGDGILALFGAPVEQKDAAWHAVTAATRMLEKLGTLNAKWQSEGHNALSIGIGIHSGEAIVGNIGSWRKLEYTAIGDAVNTAARIESKTRTSIERYNAHILLSGATVEELERWEHYVDVFAMEIEQLKGKTELTQLFVLRGLVGAGRKGGSANA